MYLVLIVLPLLGSIVSGFFGRKVGVSGAQLITSSSIFVTTILSVFAFFEVGLNNIPVSLELFRWVDSETLNVSWAFNFDSLTVSMLIPVLIVSFLVHIYSIGYMSHDPHNQRFFSYLSLFTFMMIILVTANNFLLMFVGWEGVGICSYLLVNFWFTRIAANQSSMSAFLTNRVGDCFLTIAIFALLWSFGNIDYSTVFSLAPFVSENSITIIGICLLIGAMAKSSQIGLHVWLPLAMEGPTPVSALIHAATMVTAGVYLLMRTSPLIEYSTIVLLLCLWIGALTTVFSSLVGLFQQDIKKVIAYSTMSQLARGFSTVNQTICVEAIKNFFIANSQITKAHDYLCHISSNFFNSSLFSLLDTNLKKRVREINRWQVIIISKLVGISEAIRLILIDIKLIRINLISESFISFIYTTCVITLLYYTFLIATSNVVYIFNYAPLTAISNIDKAITVTETKNKANNESLSLDTNLIKFNEWLAGLMDGNGCFILTKKGYVSCKITMNVRDIAALYEIKHKFGGAITSVSGDNALRYKVRHKKGVLSFINAVNGLIRNPTRMLQLNKLCIKYGINFREPLALTFYNGWYSGFVDSDGSVHLNEISGQVFISVTQKNKYILEPLQNLYGGKIYILSPKKEAFKYVVFRKNEISNLIDKYFSKYPLRTTKASRLALIRDFYELRPYRKPSYDNLKQFNKWVTFLDKWEKSGN